MPKTQEKFDVDIYPSEKRHGFNWKEIWQYRDMVRMMVRRDYTAGYKQTILGPAWAVIQPIVSTAVSAFVFGGLAGLSPSGIPTFLFYMASQALWGFFSGALNMTANTFLENAGLMGKIYFPRLIAPIAGITSSLISAGINAAIFAAFYIGFVVAGTPIAPNATIALLPVYFLHLAMLGIGAGSILSAMTTKYRDTVFLISYGITFWMYLSPVMYDLSIVPERWQSLYLLNPVSVILEHARYALFDYGQTYWGHYLIAVLVTVALLAIGGRVFSRVERNFIDTI